MTDTASASMGSAKNAKVAQPKAKGMKKPAKKATHPTYFDMVASAIVNLKERSGSSRQAILKAITHDHNDLGELAKNRMALALKRGVAKGMFKQVKGSFKVTEEGKVAMGGAAPKPARRTVTKAAAPAKKAVAKRPAAPKKAGRPKKAITKTAKPKAAKPKKTTKAVSKKPKTTKKAAKR